MYINTYVYIYIYIYHFFVKYHVFRQCQWDTSCRSRRELSNAIVKRDFRKAGVEIWPFPFRNAPTPVTSLIGQLINNVLRGISVTSLIARRINNVTKIISLYMWLFSRAGSIETRGFSTQRRGAGETWFLGGPREEISGSWRGPGRAAPRRAVNDA